MTSVTSHPLDPYNEMSGEVETPSLIEKAQNEWLVEHLARYDELQELERIITILNEKQLSNVNSASPNVYDGLLNEIEEDVFRTSLDRMNKVLKRGLSSEPSLDQ